jgi:hypothetical protein
VQASVRLHVCDILYYVISPQRGPLDLLISNAAKHPTCLPMIKNLPQRCLQLTIQTMGVQSAIPRSSRLQRPTASYPHTQYPSTTCREYILSSMIFQTHTTHPPRSPPPRSLGPRSYLQFPCALWPTLIILTRPPCRSPVHYRHTHPGYLDSPLRPTPHPCSSLSFIQVDMLL